MIVDVDEHSEIKIYDDSNKCNIFTDDKLQEFNKLYEEGDKKYLGLHQEFSSGQLILKSYYYIGCRWFDEQKEEYIRISPKKTKDKKQADYLKMFLICLKDPIVSKKMDGCYEIKFNEKWIDIKDNKDEITPFLILHFLSVVKKISQKGLKKGYVKVTENLTSKIKGKILIKQTIKHNHFKNRLDKTVCNHQIFTVDCLENRILKTALMQSSKYLHGIDNNDDLSKLLKYNLSSFEMVDSQDVQNSDFVKIKHSPFYKEYKEALKLAQMIFKRLGFTLNSKYSNDSYKIPPFCIDMPELFERYVEVKLREKYPEIIDGNREGKFEFNMRPDFLLPSKNMILDAKYKYWYAKANEDNDFKEDYQQLSLYSRAKNIRKRILLENSNEEANLVFIYPVLQTDNELNLDIEFCSNFTSIKRVEIKIPLKEN